MVEHDGVLVDVQYSGGWVDGLHDVVDVDEWLNAAVETGCAVEVLRHAMLCEVSAGVESELLVRVYKVCYPWRDLGKAGDHIPVNCIVVFPACAAFHTRAMLALLGSKRHSASGPVSLHKPCRYLLTALAACPPGFARVGENCLFRGAYGTETLWSVCCRRLLLRGSVGWLPVTTLFCRGWFAMVLAWR